MKAPINKNRAKKKFLRAEFSSLRQHENVKSAYQQINGYGELEVLCRYCITKDKKVEITPIGVVVSNNPIEGDIQLKLVKIADAEGVAIQDIDTSGKTLQTLGIHMSNDIMEGLIHYENIHHQILPQLR